MTQRKIILYDPAVFNFAKTVQNLYNACFDNRITDLSFLHQELVRAKTHYDVFNEYTDQDSMFHTLFYENMEKEFLPLYEKFIHEYIRPLYQEKIVYQKNQLFGHIFRII